MELKLNDGERIEKITPFLLSWYEQNARVLPWRSEPKPYYVWISEVMLQQTRVEAVKPYFERFITKLPTIQALAECEEEQLLKLWEGLGYYNRVRNLQKAARVVVEKYDGELPRDYELLLKLPGVGSYTAGAIASIAYHIAVPAVDGNVLRVMARFTESYEDIAKVSVKKKLEELLRNHMPEGEAGTFNQALMEVGATVCLPNGEPKCLVCPMKKLCLAHENKVELELPVKTKKKARRIEEMTVFLIRNQGKILLNKRENTCLLAGMYEFPHVEGKLDEKKAREAVESWKIKAKTIEALQDAKHIFSHIEWHMKGYLVESDWQENIIAEKANYDFKKQKEEETQENLEWFSVEKICEEIAIPSAFAVYTEIVKKGAEFS